MQIFKCDSTVGSSGPQEVLSRVLSTRSKFAILPEAGPNYTKASN